MSFHTPENLEAAGLAAWSRLLTPPIAHRGLWRPLGPPENSLAGFEAACRAGYGIELDVQLTADGQPVVFHDQGLERMTGAQGPLGRRTLAELSRLRLGGTDQPIPTLAEALGQVAGRVLVLVELKASPGAEAPLAQAVAELLALHTGPHAVIGFNPFALAWFAEHRPGVARGLTSYAYDDEPARTLTPEQRRALAGFEHAAVARPHFLLPSLGIAAGEPVQRRRCAGLPAIAWTVRSPVEAARLHSLCDNIIFEGFAP